MPRPIAPAPITAIIFTSTDSPREGSWRHGPSTAGHDRRTGFFHRGSPRLIPDFEQTFARAPRLLLSLRPRGELRQDRASRLMMLVLVRINYVVVKAGDVLLSHRFQKFQELDVSPAPHGLARHECRRNALDGREQRAEICEDRALRLQRIELLQRDAQRAGLFFKQLVMPRLITGKARERKLR